MLYNTPLPNNANEKANFHHQHPVEAMDDRSTLSPPSDGDDEDKPGGREYAAEFKGGDGCGGFWGGGGAGGVGEMPWDGRGCQVGKTSEYCFRVRVSFCDVASV